MTSPFTTAGLAIGAAKVATTVASKVAGKIADSFHDNISFDSLSFDKVLSGQPAELMTDSKVQMMIDKVSEAIRARLADVGIGTEPPIEVNVLENGSPEVSTRHPRAAEIQSILSQMPDIVEQFRQIRRATGIDRIVVGNL